MIFGTYREPWRQEAAENLSFAIESGHGVLKRDINPRTGFVRGAVVVVRRESNGDLLAYIGGESVSITAFDLR